MRIKGWENFILLNYKLIIYYLYNKERAESPI